MNISEEMEPLGRKLMIKNIICNKRLEKSLKILN